MKTSRKLHFLKPFQTHDQLKTADYASAFSPPLGQRNAQQVLRELRQEGLVELHGKSRASSYRLGDAGRDLLAEVNAPPCDTVGQSLQLLRQPQMLRPVRGHRAEFLRAYGAPCPGYLDEDARKRLLALGRDSGGLPKEADGSTFTPESWKRLTDLCWNSCRLEGSRLSRNEAASVLDQTEPLQETPSREKLMLLNHQQAVDRMIAAPSYRTLERHAICNLHALLMADLLHASSEEGRLRDKPMMIPGSCYVPLADAEEIAAELDLLLAKAAAIENPYEQSLFLLVQLSYLHPFAEGNGCVARMAANIPLLNACLTSPDTPVPPATLLTFVDVRQRDYDLAMRAVCELNDVTLIGNLFQHACGRACAPQSSVFEPADEIDSIRIRYRKVIAEPVLQYLIIFFSSHDPNLLADRIVANRVPEQDRAAVRAAVDQALNGLHEGNLARYGVPPGLFKRWNERRASTTVPEQAPPQQSDSAPCGPVAEVP